MFLKGENYQWERIDDYLERTIVGYDEALMMTLVKFKKDGVGYLHQHFHSQVAFIVQGTFEVQIESEKQILNGGDSFFIPTNKMHGVICLEDGLLVETFSPMRKDFLKTDTI